MVSCTMRTSFSFLIVGDLRIYGNPKQHIIISFAIIIPMLLMISSQQGSKVSFREYKALLGELSFDPDLFTTSLII